MKHLKDFKGLTVWHSLTGTYIEPGSSLDVIIIKIYIHIITPHVALQVQGTGSVGFTYWNSSLHCQSPQLQVCQLRQPKQNGFEHFRKCWTHWTYRKSQRSKNIQKSHNLFWKSNKIWCKEATIFEASFHKVCYKENSELGSYESIARNSATAHDTQPGTTPCLHMFGTHQVLVFDAQVPSQVVEG